MMQGFKIFSNLLSDHPNPNDGLSWPPRPVSVQTKLPIPGWDRRTLPALLLHPSRLPVWMLAQSLAHSLWVHAMELSADGEGGRGWVLTASFIVFFLNKCEIWFSDLWPFREFLLRGEDERAGGPSLLPRLSQWLREHFVHVFRVEHFARVNKISLWNKFVHTYIYPFPVKRRTAPPASLMATFTGREPMLNIRSNSSLLRTNWVSRVSDRDTYN